MVDPLGRALLSVPAARSIEVVDLGRGMRRRPGKPPKLLVWFALDLAHPDAAVRL